MTTITLRGKKIQKVGNGYGILIPKAIVENTDNLPLDTLLDFDIVTRRHEEYKILSLHAYVNEIYYLAEASQ